MDSINNLLHCQYYSIFQISFEGKCPRKRERRNQTEFKTILLTNELLGLLVGLIFNCFKTKWYG